jgi:hypothetical protein
VVTRGQAKNCLKALSEDTRHQSDAKTRRCGSAVDLTGVEAPVRKMRWGDDHEVECALLDIAVALAFSECPPCLDVIERGRS